MAETRALLGEIRSALNRAVRATRDKSRFSSSQSTTTVMDIPPVLQWPINFCAVTTVAVFVVSVITGNVSQIDRLWTFLPWIYTAYFAFLPLWPRIQPFPLSPYTPAEVTFTDTSPRTLLIFGLVTLWMIRLTYNTWRRGLFNPSDEDYRWQILRQKMSPLAFLIFNFVFIAMCQSILLLILATPAYFAVHQPHTPLVTSDFVLAALTVVDVALEFTADNQQYGYQTLKHEGVRVNNWIGARIDWTPADLKRGFASRGLWAWSRHPNFLCEQTFWILLTLFPLLAPAPPNFPSRPFTVSQLYPLLAAITQCWLFFSSTQFTESISLGKYPVTYAAYQRRVAMFIPMFTPLWGLLLRLSGEKEAVDRLVYGEGEDKAVKGGKNQ